MGMLIFLEGRRREMPFAGRGKRQVLGVQEPVLKAGAGDKSSFKARTVLGRGTRGWGVSSSPGRGAAREEMLVVP